MRREISVGESSKRKSLSGVKEVYVEDCCGKGVQDWAKKHFIEHGQTELVFEEKVFFENGIDLDNGGQSATSLPTRFDKGA